MAPTRQVEPDRLTPTWALLLTMASMSVGILLAATARSPAVLALVCVQGLLAVASTPARLAAPALEFPVLLASCGVGAVAVATAVAHAAAASLAH